MGNFVSKVKSGVKWLGSCVCKVVSWFKSIVEKISKIVQNFLFSIEKIINDADDKKNFGEAAGIKKEIIELNKEYKKREEKMTKRDKQNLDSLFQNPDY